MEHDDKGVLCRYTKKDGWMAMEDHCVDCGYVECRCEKRKYWVMVDIHGYAEVPVAASSQAEAEERIYELDFRTEILPYADFSGGLSVDETYEYDDDVTDEEEEEEPKPAPAPVVKSDSNKRRMFVVTVRLTGHAEVKVKATCREAAHAEEVFYLDMDTEVLPYADFKGGVYVHSA